MRRFLWPTGLVLSACVSYAPDPLLPHEALRTLIERAEQGIRTEHAGPWQAEWFPLQAEVRIADGLGIGEANALALYYSPAIRAARADARVAGAQVLQAGVLANPELFLGPRISSRDSEVIFPASLSWELPLWGTRDAQRDLAEARLTERQLQVIALELETLRQVRTKFLRLARLQREEEVLDALAAASRQIVEWVEGLRGAGEVDPVAVFLARTERDEAAAALETVRNDAIRERHALLGLLGLLPNAPVDISTDAAERLPYLGEHDADALLRLPRLRAAEAEYAAAEAALRLEVRRQYPTIRFGPEFEDDRGDATIGLGLGVTLPLFDRNRGNIAAAEESRRRARESYQGAVLAAAHAEAEARDDLRAVERVLEIYRHGALRDVEEAARSLQSRLRTGRATVVEVLTAQRAIARARARLLELEEQAAVARLRVAVAGGLALQQPMQAGEEETRK